MFADVLIPPDPNFVNDWYLIGWPASLIVPLALAASLIAVVIGFVRRGRPKRNLLLIVICLVTFLSCDLIVYGIGLQYDLWPRPKRTGYRELNPKQETSTIDAKQ